MTGLAALALATAVLVIIPGPNVALIVANTLRFGFRMGAVTVFGTTAGIALQLMLVVAGFAAVIEVAAGALTWIRWAGVIYLVWLGIRSWRAPPADLAAVAAAPTLFSQGLLLAAVNPKTLLFSAAFIPQFIPGGASVADLTAATAIYLSVVMIGDLLWAAFAGSASRLLASSRHWRNRATGAFLILAGVGLALARR